MMDGGYWPAEECLGRAPCSVTAGGGLWHGQVGGKNVRGTRISRSRGPEVGAGLVWMRKGRWWVDQTCYDNKLQSRMNDCTLCLHSPVSGRTGHAWFTCSAKASCKALSVGGEVIRKELRSWPCLRLMCLWLFYFPSLLISWVISHKCSGLKLNEAPSGCQLL